MRKAVFFAYNVLKHKNSVEVDIAPAIREIITACNVGQAKKWSWCVLEKCVKDNHYARFHTAIAAAERNALYF